MIFHVMFLIIKRRVNAMLVEGNEDVPFEFFFVVKREKERTFEDNRFFRLSVFFLFLFSTRCTTDHHFVVFPSKQKEERERERETETEKDDHTFFARSIASHSITNTSIFLSLCLCLVRSSQLDICNGDVYLGI